MRLHRHTQIQGRQRRGAFRSGPSRRRTFIAILAAGAIAQALPGCIALEYGVPALLTGSSQQEFVFELGPVDLTADASHDSVPQPAMLQTTSPVTGWIQGFAVEIIDSAGDTVPSPVLHHVRLITPSKRELFHPIMLRLVGAGSETRGVKLPSSVGYPMVKGDSLLVSAMVHNPTGRSYRGVRVRLRLRYTPAVGERRRTAIYPFFVHVTPPEESSAYDLPPGRSERSWEGRPAAGGRILGVSGHLHRYGVGLRLEDVTTGRLLWSTRARADADGQILEIPRKIFVWSRGVALRSDHVYRVTAIYDNPTGDTLRAAGMGTIGGVIVPSEPWPAVDRNDPLFRIDLARELAPTPDHAHHAAEH